MKPTRKPRAIVSVPFDRADFEAVSLAAERAGLTTSRFIREAALALAITHPSIGHVEFAGIGVGAALFSPDVAMAARTTTQAVTVV